MDAPLEAGPRGPGPLTRRATLAGALGLAVTACGGQDRPSAGPSGTATPTPTPTARATAPGTTPGTTAPTPGADPALPVAPDRVSLPTLMRERFPGGRVTRVRRQAVTDAYERWEVTYPAGRRHRLGDPAAADRPRPFPAVVLAHGYIDPAVYVTGQGLAREQDRLARAGFVVLHTDYRGHAASDPVGEVERESRLGYTRDVLHAVGAVKRLPYVDPDRVALLGRSMGGGVALNALVAQPGAVRAAVLFASVSSLFVENLRTFTVPGRPAVARRFEDRFGTPRSAPEVYAGLSSRTYFDRVSEPLLIHHGSSDDTCPIAWSRTTHRLLGRAGAQSRLEVYRGEEHAFIPQWPLSMDRTVAFLRRRMPA